MHLCFINIAAKYNLKIAYYLYLAYDTIQSLVHVQESLYVE